MPNSAAHRYPATTTHAVVVSDREQTRPSHADRQRRGFLRLAGGTRRQLRYTDRGTGRPVVFVHGWLSAAQQWAEHAAALQRTARVITYDHPGHGRSDDALEATVPALAADLHQLLAALDVSRVTLIGHAMGCSVIWAYLHLFGDERVDRLVFVDPSPVMLIDPTWDEPTAAAAGATLTEHDVQAIIAGLTDPATREQLLHRTARNMADPDAEPELIDRILTWNRRVPADFGAALYADHVCRDWRSAIAAITRPTLVVAGRASVVPWTGSKWIADTIPGARLEIIEQVDGGTHLRTVGNPARFAESLSDFIG